MRLGDSDKGIGDTSQLAVEAADTVRPSGRVQRRRDHGHPGYLCCDASPKHLVARADRDHDVNPATVHQMHKAWQHTHVVFAGQ